MEDVASEMMLECLPDKFVLPKRWGEWALGVRKDWSDKHVRACANKFREYYVTRKIQKRNWELVWHSWVRNQRTDALSIKEDKHGWWTSAQGITKKGEELGIEQNSDELFPYFKLRVFKSAGTGPWNRS